MKKKKHHPNYKFEFIPEIIAKIYEKNPCLASVARKLGTNYTLIGRRLKEIGIPIKRLQNKKLRCQFCDNIILKQTEWPIQKYCSKKCYGRSRRGKPFSKKHRQNISDALKGKESLWTTGSNNIQYRGDLDKSEIKRLYTMGYSVSAIGKFLNCSRNAVANRLKIMKIKIRHRLKSPNSNELFLSKVIKKANLPFKFVGDRKFWVGSKCPDFIDIKNRKIIELFSDWHIPGKIKKNVPYLQTAKGTKEYYKTKNYQILILWPKDLNNKNILQKLKKFGNS